MEPSIRQRFETIYATDEWGQGSGEGSYPVHTRGYIRFLQRFIKQHNIKSVVDLGCGDWQFSRFIDWSGVDYHGFDLVASVIDNNRERYGAPGIRFLRYDGDFSELPKADLLIAKDVLQHWSNDSVINFLPHLPRYPKALLTNCINPLGPTTNQDIPDGGFRYLDLRLAPFNIKAKVAFSFTNHRSLKDKLFGKPRWRKNVLLFRH